MIRSVRGYNGVINWMENNNIDIGEPPKKTFRAKDEHFNNFFIKFGRENGIEMVPNNKKGYKGSFTPSLANADKIQENWKLFKAWALETYKPETEEASES